MAAAWKAAWSTVVAMLYMPSSYANVLEHNKSEASTDPHFLIQFSSGKNWVEAENECINQGGHLASITSQAENDIVSGLCASQQGSYFCWIGGRKPEDDLSSGAFYWSDGTLDTTYTNKDYNHQFVGVPDQPYLGMRRSSGTWQFEALHHTYTAAVCELAEEASGTGDPHLQNMRGERFDLLRPGKFLLINIPRGRPVEDALLVVEADAYRPGGYCADIYFVEVNITGAWADMAQPGGLRFDAYTALDEKPKWAKLGPAELKVAHGRTAQGTRYLNVYVKHLGRAGFAVGGLLGEDDHSEAVVPTDGCIKTLALSRKHEGNGLPRPGSVAEAA